MPSALRMFCYLALCCLMVLGVAAGPLANGAPVGTLPCTSGNLCTTAPVIVHFPSSDSCNPAAATSISSFFNNGPNWPEGKCNALHSVSYIYNVAADRKSFSYSQWFHPGCDGPARLLEYRALGLCINTTQDTPSSTMILASKQDSLPTSGDLTAHPLALPTINQRSGIKCLPSAKSCGYAWMTSYSDSKCTQPTKSFSSPLYTTNQQPIQLNGCYSLRNARGDLTNNVEYRCANGMSSIVTYQGAGCQSQVLNSVSYPLGACIDIGYGSYGQYFC